MKNIALVVVILWIALVMVACQTTETPPAATPCRDDTAQSGFGTAVTVTLLDETNTRLEGVQVSYRVNGGEWVAYPERVNGRVTLTGATGTYQIRAQKPGYRTTETIVPLAAFSCEGEPALTTIILPTAQCPVSPHPLLIQLPPAGSPHLHAGTGEGHARALTCQEQDGHGCRQYALPLQQGDAGNFSLEIEGLPDIGDMEVVDGVVSYATAPYDLTLSQGNRQQTFDLAAVASATLTLPVERDEVGCPWVDLTAVTLTTTTAYPEPGVYLAGNLLMTDLSAEVCQQTPILSDITYSMKLPPGTHLEEVQMIYWRDEAWVTGECRLEGGQYLCTAQLPNPLINQFYSVRAVVNGIEHIGTQLPFSNLCMVFSEGD
ncbi:MAG: hypothetical protein HND44_20115 [Chloroflexi bacterium]|nr:hypothetical protein [Ardenticatenaceae bacterium]MBL1130756.1 hypothetical protein [Chloroflexota bacterium]NOG36851.1 hypothetical protein [Chloroflexota bacterium]GIK57956.1 MAG: hypothetical protein BroJett015_36190 [Chloroflexota bacterium]